MHAMRIGCIPLVITPASPFPSPPLLLYTRYTARKYGTSHAIISRDKISHSWYGFEYARENTALAMQLAFANQRIARADDANTA